MLPGAPIIGPALATEPRLVEASRAIESARADVASGDARQALERVAELPRWISPPPESGALAYDEALIVADARLVEAAALFDLGAVGESEEAVAGAREASRAAKRRIPPHRPPDGFEDEDSRQSRYRANWPEAWASAWDVRFDEDRGEYAEARGRYEQMRALATPRYPVPEEFLYRARGLACAIRSGDRAAAAEDVRDGTWRLEVAAGVWAPSRPVFGLWRRWEALHAVHIGQFAEAEDLLGRAAELLAGSAKESALTALATAHFYLERNVGDDRTVGVDLFVQSYERAMNLELAGPARRAAHALAQYLDPT